MCPPLGCWMPSVGKSEDDKAVSNCALLCCCQPESQFRMESGNGAGGITILRGLWCLFCFHTVLKDNLKSTAKLALTAERSLVW